MKFDKAKLFERLSLFVNFIIFLVLLFLSACGMLLVLEFFKIAKELQMSQERIQVLEFGLSEKRLELQKIQEELKKAKVQADQANELARGLLDEKAFLYSSLSRLVKELNDRPYVEKVLQTVGTGYTANDSGMDGRGITYTGTKVEQGRTIAVDPNVIPLGSTVAISSESYPSINGIYVAEDTGSAIKGNKVDIYFEDREEALKFGVRKDLVVKILSIPNKEE